ncbi:helix-turn-helix domain-containing protein [Qipengyuania sp. 902]|uniref:helix-turn-helix domain-containing protein n=1 Tax=Qipengyuania sp. 902 TaxID=3417565 RepID=UPI003EBF3BD2
MITCTPDGRVTRAEAARFLGFTAKTLAEWHRKGIGPSSLLIGGRRFYRLEELRLYAAGEKQVRPKAA